MRLLHDNDIFNITDTNGRRSDIMTAYSQYLTILDECQKKYGEWKRFPESLVQYEFYKNAIALGAHAFREHPKYDEFKAQLDQNSLRASFEKKDINTFSAFPKMAKVLDNGIEDRSRHYTNILCKIGFCDQARHITATGYDYMGKAKVNCDPIEELLCLDPQQLVLFRQLLKLRIWDKDMKIFYHPGIAVLYALSQAEHLNALTLFKCIHLVTPSMYGKVDFKKLVNDLENGKSHDVLDALVTSVADVTKPVTNGKSQKQEQKYNEFMKLLDAFVASGSAYDFKGFITFYKENASALNKAFSVDGTALFNILGRAASDKEVFLAKNKDNVFIMEKNRQSLYQSARAKANRADGAREYANELVKVFRSSGTLSVDNGLASLPLREIYKIINLYAPLDKLVFGTGDEKEYQSYEGDFSCGFYQTENLSHILGLTDADVEQICARIKEEVGDAAAIAARNKQAIESKLRALATNNFPVAKLVENLPLFEQRTAATDHALIDFVGGDTDVPTAYEYLVAMSFYHLSQGTMNIADSIRMSLTGDGYPYRFAAGGGGDIVIEGEKEITLVEVTLMNAHSQEKGETTPVIRHTLDLMAANPDKKVRTYFVAPEISPMSKAIWEAISQSPFPIGDTEVSGVSISPMTNAKLIALLVDTQ